MKISIELDDLKMLLNQQKIIVADKLLGQTYSYNPESTESNYKSMDINKEVFKDIAIKAEFPHDVIVLSNYLL